MRTFALFFCLLFLALSINGQKYLSKAQDVGFDIALVIIDKAAVRSAPNINSAVVGTFNKTYRLTLLSREPTDKVWYEVSDITTLIKGWIHGNYIELYLSSEARDCEKQTETEKESPFTAEYVGGTVEPSLEIYNDSDRLLTLEFGGVKYYVLTKQSRTISFPPGLYEYSATAPRVGPLTGKERFERGYKYKWRFYIVTTYR